MNKNSALIWFPKIEGKLPTIKTRIIQYNHRSIIAVFDGVELSEMAELIESVSSACREIGYPVFIRTDLSSAKHDGPTAYKVNDESEIERVLLATIEDNEMKFWLEPEGPSAIMVREWVDFDAPFCAFHGHAISREWRFFADNKSVKCFHPYWPKSSIEFFSVEQPKGWEEMLYDLHKIPDNIEQLKEYAIAAASKYGCFCSVDIAMDKAGNWLVVDMATAEDSYHWPGCDKM